MTEGAMTLTSSGETNSLPSSTARALAARCRAKAARGDIPSADRRVHAGGIGDLHDVTAGSRPEV